MSEPRDPGPGSSNGDDGRLIGGRYRLGSVVGRGGMATIFAALDESAGRRVAVKLLKPEVATDTDLAARFRREALAATVLVHPNIVPCLDTGSDPAGPYLVMALIDGEDLTARLRSDGRIAPADAARIARDVARGLGVAHARGIVHRDVKPGNILLATDGRALITDFGIARLLDDPEGAVAGTILGSVQYLSPEQAQGEATTPASDTYALGLVLYEILTGSRPWTGDSSSAIALARVGAPAPSPRALVHDVPVALDRVVLRALDPDPSRRYQDGSAMAAALDRLLVAPAPRPDARPVVLAAPDPPPSTTRRRRTVAPALAVLAMVGVVFGSVAIAAIPGDADGRPFAVASPTAEPSGSGAATPEPTPPSTPEPTTAPATPEPSGAPSPTAAVATRAPTTAPVADLCDPIFGFACGLDPGRYGPSRFEPAVTFTLGDGWATELHSADRVAVVRPEGRLTLLGDVTRTYPKGVEVEATGALRKVIGRIAATRGAEASKVRGLKIDGHDGYSVDLTTDRDGLPILGVGEDTFFLAPRATTRFVLLDLGDRTLALIIEPSRRRSLEDILATADDVAGTLEVQ